MRADVNGLRLDTMLGQTIMIRFFITTLALCFTAIGVHACTIFVLTDTNRVLFCNNEDGENTNTRIWFVPASTNHYGCVFVGYNDGWAQGGMNTKGLAFDWVAGWKEEWNPDPALPKVRSNQQMLETCANAEEAILFYQQHRDPNLSYSKAGLTDKTGTSVCIGAHDGKLQVATTNQSCGFGYGGQTLQTLLAESPTPTVTNGVRISRACLEDGQTATRYFNIFDVKSGEIYLYPSPHKDDEVTLNLDEELKKGAHYYDMVQIRKQLKQPPQPLLVNMLRFEPPK